jgi:hypothetical protein
MNYFLWENFTILDLNIQNPISSSIEYGVFFGGKAMKKLNS